MATAAWNFEGKVALVIGASSGIGRAIAGRLAGAGAKVIAVARREQMLLDLASGHGDAILALSADIMADGQLEDVMTRAVDHFGRIDIAFNVAGGGQRGSITDLSDADWDRIVDLNMRSIFRATKLQARQMIAQGAGGAIVNIASINAIMPQPGGIAYASTKAGMMMLTQNAAMDLAGHGIRVNALLPGLVRTAKTEALLASPRISSAYMVRIPMRRSGEMDEITGPALFLASAEASYMTGAALIVDGGWSQAGYPDLGPGV